MSNSSKKISVIVVLILVVVAAIIFILTQANSDLKNDEQDAPLQTHLSNSVNSKPTIGTEWQWQDAQKRSTQVQATTNKGVLLPFTAESVYSALQAVKIDADGDIILDHDALLSLDETLERIHSRLNSESLSILQALIKEALPGKSGEQTAQIVGDYYLFLEAKEEFSQMHEALPDTNNEKTLESIESDEVLYAELQALREVHINKEVTESLFRVSDANAQYMFDSMKLASDDSLTPEEREIRRQEIEARHLEQSINITNWPARYKAFLNSKQNIVTASIDEEEKRKQLYELLRRHFNGDELKRIKYLGLDQP